MLNYEYKIWAKAIANRLGEVLGDLISKNQYGFVKGRSIFRNIHRTVEIVSHLNKSKKPKIVVQIDFEKCFDRVEFNSI